MSTKVPRDDGDRRETAASFYIAVQHFRKYTGLYEKSE